MKILYTLVNNKLEKGRKIMPTDFEEFNKLLLQIPFMRNQ